MTIHDDMQALLDRRVVVYSRVSLDAAVCRHAADRAIYSPYGPHAVGRDAIRRTHEAWHASGETNKSVTVIDAGGEGDTAWCVAAYSGDYPQPDGSLLTESGVSLNVAAQQPDGSWLIRISSLNSDTPPLAEG